MGLLAMGTPLSWEETQAYVDHVKKEGVNQFIQMYQSNISRDNDPFVWGDETEYIIITYDDGKKEARLNLRAWDIVQELLVEEEKAIDAKKPFLASWRPEYARYMIEGMPSSPYGDKLKDLAMVENHMNKRRCTIRGLLGKNESVMTMTCFPSLGATEIPFLANKDGIPIPFDNAISKSSFIPDAAISPHARFHTLTRHIRLRRRRNISIHVPIMKDESDDNAPFMDHSSSNMVNNYTNERVNKPDHILLDCMCFGMGCCCLQTTFQLSNITEARYVYDQLGILAPIMLAMTAASPIMRGYLCDRDSRWDVISASVDDRTSEESGENPLVHASFRIPKSRYASISCFIGNQVHPRYNDLALVYDHTFYKKLIGNGVDELLAKHISHLFIRDPLVIYKEYIHQPIGASGHFDNIQSTNWQTVRFKPPIDGMGWRVEFRPMEVQLTDFENAAMSVFMALITKVITTYHINLYIPISLVDVNMQRAQTRDGLRTQKFYFRQNIQNAHTGGKEECTEMTINDIINGNGESNKGLLSMIRKYIEERKEPNTSNEETIDVIEKYLLFISDKASGKVKTVAQSIRDFVNQHPSYAFDGKITSAINYDIIRWIDNLSTQSDNPK